MIPGFSSMPLEFRLMLIEEDCRADKQPRAKRSGKDLTKVRGLNAKKYRGVENTETLQEYKELQNNGIRGRGTWQDLQILSSMVLSTTCSLTIFLFGNKNLVKRFYKRIISSVDIEQRMKMSLSLPKKMTRISMTTIMDIRQ